MGAEHHQLVLNIILLQMGEVLGSGHEAQPGPQWRREKGNRIILQCESWGFIIGPGEVKVDLADFDLKLQENLLGTIFI